MASATATTSALTRFFIVNMHRLLRQPVLRLAAGQAAGRADLVADDPDHLRHAALDLRAPPPLGLRMSRARRLSLIIPGQGRGRGDRAVRRRGSSPVLEAIDDPAAKLVRNTVRRRRQHRRHAGRDPQGACRRPARPRRSRCRAISARKRRCPPGSTMPRGQAVVPIDVDLQDPPEVLGDDDRQMARGLSRSSTACATTARPTACPSG